MAKRRGGGKSRISVTLAGPILEGLTAPIMRAFLVDAVDRVSKKGENELRVKMGASFKHPTGHYASRIHTNRISADRVKINDSHVIYGPWLEGTSKRNESTRFKGYKTFRKTRLWLRRKAGPEAQELMETQYLSQLGGGR